MYLPKKKRFLFLSALIGSATAFLTYSLNFKKLGLVFSVQGLLVTLAMGALLGGFFGNTGANHSRSLLVVIAIAAFVGLITPFFVIQLMFLVFGPGDL